MFYPAQKKVRMNFSKRYCSYTNDGREWTKEVLLLHWMNQNTYRVRYQWEVARLYHGGNIWNDVLYSLKLFVEKLVDFKYGISTIIHRLLCKNRKHNMPNQFVI